MTRIRIVGGGIAGLALAASLDPERFDVTLVEQRAELPDIRTILAMWPEAVDSARDDRHGRRRAEREPVDRPLPAPQRHGPHLVGAADAGGVLVARDDLLAALDAAVPASVARVTERVERVVAEPGELVVGADGVHSIVRRSGWGDRADATLTPYLAVRGVLPEFAPPRPRGSTGAEEPLRRGTAPLGHELVRLVPLRSRPAARRRRGGARRARHGIGDLAPGLARVLAAADARDDARPAHLDRAAAALVRARAGSCSSATPRTP